MLSNLLIFLACLATTSIINILSYNFIFNSTGINDLYKVETIFNHMNKKLPLCNLLSCLSLPRSQKITLFTNTHMHTCYLGEISTTLHKAVFIKTQYKAILQLW